MRAGLTHNNGACINATQVAVLAIFVVLTVVAVIKFTSTGRGPPEIHVIAQFLRRLIRRKGVDDCEFSEARADRDGGRESTGSGDRSVQPE